MIKIDLARDLSFFPLEGSLLFLEKKKITPPEPKVVFPAKKEKIAIIVKHRMGL